MRIFAAAMVDYMEDPRQWITREGVQVASFLSSQEVNIDWTTVNSFGEEWKKFNAFSEAEIQDIGNDYFDLTDDTIINSGTVALDVGCGSGRWARYLSSRVKFIEAIDPSDSVFSASLYLGDKTNVRVTQASVNHIPFPDQRFDFVYSLGVLHHLPDTQQAIEKCRDKVKAGGWFLLYLYYALENRNLFYRFLFSISTVFRKLISSLPSGSKKFVCDVIAATVYFPLASLAAALHKVKSLRSVASALPLAYYRKTSFHVMRNDALDRFGTPLEKRFTKQQIENMLKQSNFINIRFSHQQPYWHVIAQRPN